LRRNLVPWASARNSFKFYLRQKAGIYNLC
jgi:hypothetical protein